MLVEIPQGATVADAVNAAGGITSDSDAVLLGGYFGGWVESGTAWGLSLDADSLRQLGYSLGCGVIAVLPSGRCGVIETARILAYLAHESARQCGPCTFGLRAISAAAGRVAGLSSTPGDLEHIQRWADCSPDTVRAATPTARRDCSARRCASSQRNSSSTTTTGGAASERRGGGVMSDRVTIGIDRIKCDGHGVCADLVPEMIELDDWGYPIIQPARSRSR